MPVWRPEGLPVGLVEDRARNRLAFIFNASFFSPALFVIRWWKFFIASRDGALHPGSLSFEVISRGGDRLPTISLSVHCRRQGAGWELARAAAKPLAPLPTPNPRWYRCPFVEPTSKWWAVLSRVRRLRSRVHSLAQQSKFGSRG